MLLVDIPRSNGSEDYLRVGVIGSCRARDLVYEAYKLDPKPSTSVDAPVCPLVWYRFSVFTHTVAQASQYQRFILGKQEIPEDLHPFVFFKKITPAIQSALGTLTPELLDTIDLYIVEVSAFKEFSVGEIVLNTSYTETNLIRAGGKPLLKWWRSVSNPGAAHQSIVQETLNALPSRDISNSEVIRSVIRNGLWNTPSEVELRDSVKAFMQNLGKEVVLVPAFNTPSMPCKSRAELIEQVYNLSIVEGCHFFDPTSVVASVEANIALKGGVDTKHYEPGFHYTLLKALVPFLQDAVTLHQQTGEYSAQRYILQEEKLKNVA